jgi:hypothetical protein
MWQLLWLLIASLVITGTQRRSMLVKSVAISRKREMSMIDKIKKLVVHIGELTEEVQSYHPNSTDYEEMDEYEKILDELDESFETLNFATDELLARIEDMDQEDNGDEDYEDD